MKLPLWRLALGVAVLGSLVLVLFALGPIYADDYRLRKYIKGLTSSTLITSMPDQQVSTAIENEARRLDLPVRTDDVKVTHAGKQVAVDVKYLVAVHFPLYNVDLHFHTAAQSQ